jgi:hypothetical protein
MGLDTDRKITHQDGSVLFASATHTRMPSNCVNDVTSMSGADSEGLNQVARVGYYMSGALPRTHGLSCEWCS